MINVLPYLAVSMGFMSSFHCIGMCGPISLALPVYNRSKIRQIAGLLIYNFGRVFSYAALGLALGTIGSAAAWIGYLRYVSILTGALMLIYLLFPSGLERNFHPPLFWKKLIQNLRSAMVERLKRRSFISFLALGALNGLLPCGMVYFALANSVATGSAFAGSIFMTLFGFGTFPAMMAAGFFKHMFTPALRTKLRRLTPVLIAIAGIVMVVRGMAIEYPASKTGNPITICHEK